VYLFSEREMFKTVYMFIYMILALPIYQMIRQSPKLQKLTHWETKVKNLIESTKCNYDINT